MIPVGIIFSILIFIMRLPIIKIHGQILPDDILALSLPIIIGIIISIMYMIICKISLKENFQYNYRHLNLDGEDEKTININEEGLSYLSTTSDVIYKWNFIKEVVNLEKEIYIIFKDNTGICIGNTYIEDQKEKAELIAQIKNKIK